ncbi:hypothetical protein I4U23_023840 [Adineta vaga]|nr:hypothetical protein I4U23_023840 [Adineta vaga]
MMMIIQWSFLVLIFVQIHASKLGSIRQATPETCANPDITFCDFIRCVNGTCVEDKASSECFKCQCEAGFTGKLCETAFVLPSECNPGCQNGGQCEQTSENTFVCVCPPEFTGSQCQTSLAATHPCVTMPTAVCQNGGTCTKNGDEYLCNCVVGWGGKNCQTQETVTQCEANTCGEHGTCIQAVTPNGPAVFCICENQWTGKFCDVNIDDKCPTGFCASGGTCVVIQNMPTCRCPPTYTGIRCETLLGTNITTTLTTPTITTVTGTTTTTTRGTLTQVPGSCSTKPCLNGGSCFNTGDSFVCLCNQLWTGPTCAISNPATITTTPSSIDACASNPCSNGGSCFKQINVGFVCFCTSAFTGPTCTIPRTTTPATTVTNSTSIKCVNQPCQNGGTCYNTGDSYFCFCGSKNGFTGKNCETSISGLSSNCPLNCSPGHCVSTGGNQNAYACMCNGILNPTSCSTK